MDQITPGECDQFSRCTVHPPVTVLPLYDSVNNMNLSTNITNSNFSADENENVPMVNCPLPEEETTLARAAKITAFAVIIATSLIGNVLVVVVTRNTQRMRKLAFTFVVNMDIADLFTTVINMPESLYVEIKQTDEWVPGHIGIILCKLLPFCQQVCSFCSVLSLLTIAFDRFCSICFPLQKLLTRKLSKVIIASTWLIPCLSSAPMFVVNNVVEMEGIHLCLEEWAAPFDSLKSPNSYTIILFVIFYILPLIIIFFLYGCVVHTIWKRNVPGNHSLTGQRLHSRSRRKSLIMFIAIVVCFSLFWLPMHVTYFLITNNEELYSCGLPKDVYFVSLFFAYAISALNPCIYITLHQDYRSGAKNVLIAWLRAPFFCTTKKENCLNSSNVRTRECKSAGRSHSNPRLLGNGIGHKESYV